MRLEREGRDNNPPFGALGLVGRKRKRRRRSASVNGWQVCPEGTSRWWEEPARGAEGAGRHGRRGRSSHVPTQPTVGTGTLWAPPSHTEPSSTKSCPFSFKQCHSNWSWSHLLHHPSCVCPVFPPQGRLLETRVAVWLPRTKKHPQG